MSDSIRDGLQRALGAGYTIVRELGGGGMSHVFVARDETLRRHVVVKLLAPALAEGVSAERFAREIHVAAALQEPHIVPVLTAGVTLGGLPYYTMPFVSGESLRARLQQGPLALSDAIGILRDVAKALAYAHREGVVHRDIKPENVLLNEGTAVVTDFGIAKALSASKTGADSPGATAALTGIGISLGTPAYMAPEQAAGDDVDARADLYSWGMIAYELLAGRHPFAEKTTAQSLIAAHIAEAPPPLLAQGSKVPAPLAALVMRCLAKPVGARPADAGELLRLLDAAGSPVTSPSSTHRRAALLMTFVGAAVAIGAAFTMWPRRASQPFTVGSTRRITAMPDLELDGTISPDGKLVAYVARQGAVSRVFVRQISGGRTVQASDTSGGNHRWPRWSPDGTELIYASDGGIYRVPTLGGPARLLVQAGRPDPGGLPFNPTASWSPDGKRIAYADSIGIVVRSVDGDDARTVMRGTELHSPAWSPDGKQLAYVSGNRNYVALVGNTSPSSIWIVSSDGGTPTLLTEELHLNTSPVFTPDGRSLLFISNIGGTRDVYELPIDHPASSVEPRRVSTGLEPYTISLTSDGSTLAYSTLRQRANIWTAPIQGGQKPADSLSAVTTENQRIEGLDLSHDRRSIVYDANRNGNADIFRIPVAGGEPTQLTSDPADDFQPVWSPDDKQVAFYSTRTGARDVYVMDADGQNVQRVTSLPASERFPTWSPDGRRLAFFIAEGSDAGVYVTERTANAWTTPRRIGKAGLQRPRWSPDGKWISAIQGASLVLIPAPAPGDTASGEPRVVAGPQGAAGVVFAAWGPDPSAVYFSAIEFGSWQWGYYAVPVSGGPPRSLLRLNAAMVKGTGGITFTTDGKRLYFTIAADEADVWTMELRRR